MNQALIDEIVSGVLAQLKPAPAPSRPLNSGTTQTNAASAPAPLAARSVATSSTAAPVVSPAPASTPLPAVALSSPVPAPAATPASKPIVVELTVPVITADILEQSVRAGQSVRFGRSSIITPAARDWLNSKRTSWSRQDKNSASANGGAPIKWQVILQTMTPTVRSLQEGLRRMTDGWKIEVVGQPLEAADLATSLVSTAECDGVVIFTEQAELIVCKANRNDRVRAAVMQNTKQWEQVMRTLSANVVCISPVGKTFVELRNLLKDCATTRPRPPAGL
ncbi:hypothetical protein [Schlesneria sp. T3-172]|uniref:hypothetical protein n=1 Tax=Schlesneria sphaerica TaxID=3373610 RepID=UPI0037C5E9D7